MEKKKRIGAYLRSSVVEEEYYDSYIPKPLPPEPPLDMRELYPLLDQANAALGRLDGMSAVLPDTSPLLYLSLYFKANRRAYYDHLQSVRDWEAWIEFFLEGVVETAGQAMETAKAV
ncbi:MAG: hypothetical protein OXK19_02695 [Candidatus Dadabacteria bacterium]|nr:hypothetical protein [Candidatus Dadabacteria bacterium]